MPDLFCCIAAVGLHLASAHIDPAPWLQERGINNINPGVELEFTSGATFGAYRNTLNGTSLYAGYTHHFPAMLRVHPVIQVGAVTYEGRPYAAALAGLQFPLTNTWDARIVYVPKIDITGAHVLHLLAIRRFK